MLRGVSIRALAPLGLGAIAWAACADATTGAPTAPSADVAPAFASGPLEVALGRTAADPTRLTDRASGVAVELRLLGARAAPGRAAGPGVTRFDGAFDGADVSSERTPDGVEDFIHFARPPREASARWSLALPEGAGLRLVERTLEVVDPSGTPRLRMAPPFLVGDRGARHEAGIAVEGCAVDTSPAPPWGRAPTPAGARTCTLAVSWAPGAVVFPAVLDPLWTGTGSMGTPRERHTATALANGRVLVAGGDDDFVVASSCELFDPATKTFAATGSMLTPRRRHTASRLADGSVWVAGGESTASTTGATERYSAATGTWSAGPTLAFARQRHTATRLADDRVVVVSGWDGGSIAIAAAEVFDPIASSLATVGAIAVPRFSHSAELLPDGRVLVAGGFPNVPEATTTCELFDPIVGAFFGAAVLFEPRALHGSTRLADGRVLVSGGVSELGLNGDIFDTPNAEIYDPSTATWAATAPMAIARYQHRLETLPTGYVLAIGGVAFIDPDDQPILNDVEVFDPAARTWTATASMLDHRFLFATAPIPNGGVLAVGGNHGGSPASTSSAEVFSPYALGTACTGGVECQSGACVDGVCCEDACSGTCRSCLGALTGGDDGACGFVKAGTDPESECKDDGGATCMGNGLCDGNGACGTYATASGCEPTPCAASDDCSSGFCVDGICCDDACTGECAGCTAALTGGTDGVCAPIPKGTDPDDECGNGTPGNCVSALLCDGEGHCVPSTDACAPYVCEADDGCKASCDGDDDCAATARCVEGSCVPRQPVCDGDAVVSPDDTRVECAPYTCDSASKGCFQRCGSVSDCAKPNVCDATGHCVPVPGATAEDGCGCRLARAEGEGSAGAFGAMAAAAAWLVGRLRRRNRPRSCRLGDLRGHPAAARPE